MRARVRRHLERAWLLACAVALGGCKGATVGEVSADGGADAADDATGDALPETWTLVYQDPNASSAAALHALVAAAPDDIWAVGDDRQILHYDGKSWGGINQVPGSDLYAVWRSPNGELTTVGANAFDLSPAVYDYDGQIWVSGAPFPATLTALSGVWGIDTQRYFTGLAGQVFQDDPVLHPTDRYHTAVITGGCPNQTDPSPNLNAIDAENLDDIMAVGDSGMIAQKDALGWARFCSQDPKVNYSCVFHVPGSSRFYVGSNYLGIALWLGRTEPLAQIHEDLSIPNADEAYVQSIAGDANRIVAVGDRGVVFYYRYGDNDVTTLSSPTAGSLYGVALVAPNTVYVAGTGNRIWRAELPLK